MLGISSCAYWPPEYWTSDMFIRISYSKWLFCLCVCVLVSAVCPGTCALRAKYVISPGAGVTDTFLILVLEGKPVPHRCSQCTSPLSCLSSPFLPSFQLSCLTCVWCIHPFHNPAFAFACAYWSVAVFWRESDVILIKANLLISFFIAGDFGDITRNALQKVRSQKFLWPPVRSLPCSSSHTEVCGGYCRSASLYSVS